MIKRRNLTLSFLMVLVAIFVAYLNINYSADSESYKLLLEEDIRLSFLDLIQNCGLFGEFLYHALTKVLGSFMLPSHALFLMVFLSILIKWRLIYLTESSILPIFVYISFFLFWFDGTLTRTSLASIFIFTSIMFLSRRKFLQSFLSIAIGSFFHLSAISYLILFPIYYVQNFRKIIRLVFYFSPIFIFFSDHLVNFLFDIVNYFSSGYGTYQYSIQNSSGLYVYYLCLLYLTVVYIDLKTIRFREESLSDRAKFANSCVAMTMLSITSSFILISNVILASRVGDILLLPIIFSFYEAYKLSDKKEKILMGAVLVFFLAARFIHAFHWNTRG